MQLSRSLLVFSAASAAFLALAGCGSNYVGSGNTGPTSYTGTSVYLLSGTTTSSSLVLAFPSGQANSPTATSSIILPSGSGTIGQYLALDPAANIYVATATDVREYAAGATGSATPTRVLPLNATTTLSNTPTGIAADASGNIYVSESTGGVAVFSGLANGSVAPARFLSGALTTLVDPFQLRVDSAGNLYVMNFIATGQLDILVFAPTANGNVAPIRTLNVNLIGFAVSSTGSVYAATQSGVEVFAPGASGTPVPTQTITNSATGQAALTGGIAVDSAGNIFLVTLGTTSGPPPNSPSIEQFANVSGNFELTNTFTPGAWSTASEPQDLIAVH